MFGLYISNQGGVAGEKLMMKSCKVCGAKNWTYQVSADRGTITATCGRGHSVQFLTKRGKKALGLNKWGKRTRIAIPWEQGE